MFTYVLPLSATEATLNRAGGKGANLARLMQAGFAVPGGFILTTDAYRAFTDANGLQARILALARTASPDQLEALEQTAAEIRALFAGASLPAGIAAEVIAAYHGIADVPDPAVAVRSSATAEDLPGLAFAGQQDTYLNIVGEQAVLEAVKKCWASLWTARAMAYRARAHISPDDVALAVVVQRMIEAEVSGVAFTANPITGRRQEIVIDATFGLGEALVSGQADPDHYVVDPQTWTITGRSLGAKQIAILPDAGGGTRSAERSAEDTQALPDRQIIELAQVARQVADSFGSPQDIEWAWAKEKLYLLQARPITSLYPLPEPPASGDALRVYVNFNGIQGVHEPFTPLGLDALRLIFSGVFRLLHIQSGPRQVLPDAGGRLFLDVTALAGDRYLRRFILSLLAGTDPGAGQTLSRLIDEGRFPNKRILTPGRAFTLLWAVLPILWRVLGGLLKPEAVRSRVVATSERFVAEARNHARTAPDLAACLRAMEDDLARAEHISLAIMPMALPAYAFMPIVDRWLTRWLGEAPGAALQLMRGLPGNVTVEMDLKLWDAAQAMRSDPAALQAQSVEALTGMYRQGKLPAAAQQALDPFMETYGMRGAGELDLGRARWREDPAPIMQTLLSYIRLQDPALAPDLVFRRGQQEAERLAADYANRARKLPWGWLRARVLGGLIRRMRTLGGLRELPLFYLVQVNALYRAALLDQASRLVADHRLERADDIFFVPLDSLKQFAQGEAVDLKAIAAANRARYEREYARKQMPRVLLSTGEAFYEGVGDTTGNDNTLAGEAVSPGIAEGPVRVILDPNAARLEPGEILVCPSTNPGWTPLFLTAGGLVMEIGGVMTHGSIVAREYGIPAVVGVHKATTRLQTGQRVRVDGSRGLVTVLE